MSWQPVSYLALRCDGDTTRGQCPVLYHSSDPTTGVDTKGREQLLPTLFLGQPKTLVARVLDAEGWMLAGDRVLCPDHVKAQERLAYAMLEGLPFDEATVGGTS